MIAIESLLFLVGGIALTVGLAQLFGWWGAGRRQPALSTPSVRLVRQVKTPGGPEETRLTINDQIILVASGEGLRPAEYAEQVERLETIASRIATSLSASVELARLGPREGPSAAGVPVRGLLDEERGARED